MASQLSLDESNQSLRQRLEVVESNLAAANAAICVLTEYVSYLTAVLPYASLKHGIGAERETELGKRRNEVWDRGQTVLKRAMELNISRASFGGDN